MDLEKLTKNLRCIPWNQMFALWIIKIIIINIVFLIISFTSSNDLLKLKIKVICAPIENLITFLMLSYAFLSWSKIGPFKNCKEWIPYPRFNNCFGQISLIDWMKTNKI